MVVSDGMGSKSLSHLGSKCICECVYDVVSNYAFDLDVISFKDIIYACHEEWKKRLSDFDIKQCYATLLVAVIRKKTIKAARLGDGFWPSMRMEKLHVYMIKKKIILRTKRIA